jgi:hypothetical protein
VNKASEDGLAAGVDAATWCDELQEAQISPGGVRRVERRSSVSIQLERGALLINSTVRRFGDLLLEETVANRTALHRIRAPQRSVSLLLSSVRSQAQFVFGYQLARDCCVILDAGAEIELIARSRSSWLLISLAAPMNGAAAACTLESILLRAGARLVTRSTNTCHALQREAVRALSGVTCQSVGSTVRALAMSVLLEGGIGQRMLRRWMRCALPERVDALPSNGRADTSGTISPIRSDSPTCAPMRTCRPALSSTDSGS